MEKEAKVLLIVPCYNEEANVKGVFDAIVAYNSSHEQKYEMLFVNDGSTDGTEELLRQYGMDHVSLIRNLGIGGAIQTGYKYACEKGFDVAVQVDGDGQHDIACVERIIGPILDGDADMVIGSRFIGAYKDGFRSSFLRRIGIRVISAVIKMKTGERIFDTTSGFRAVGQSLISEFARNYPVEYPEPISSVAVLNGGYRIRELPAKMRMRTGGSSSIRAWKTAYYMVNVVLSILLSDGKFRGRRRA